MTCRYCPQPLAESDAVITHSYWQGLPFHCHKDCKQSGEREEAIECQTIDASCNDCKHFQRGKLIERELSCIVNNKASTRVMNMGIFTGHCLKFNEPTFSYPKKWDGKPCFEHRKSLLTSSTR